MKRYRTTLYYGRENEQLLKDLANKAQIPVSTFVRLCFDMGLDILKTQERRLDNGNK